MISMFKRKTQTFEESLNEDLKGVQSSTPFLRNPLNWIIFLSLLAWHQSCSLASKVDHAVQSYTRAPVLVQVGRDGKPIMAQQSPDGALNDTNINAFLADIVPMLYRFDVKLPEIKGIDPGEKVEGIEEKIPSTIFLASNALDPVFAKTWLPGHIKTAKEVYKMQGLMQGQSRGVLANIAFKPPEKQGAFKSVTVFGNFIVENENQKEARGHLWVRKFLVKEVPRPRYILQPTQMEQKFNAVLDRGLQIVDITDDKSILP
ncbi:MAG: hypothetical protein ACRCYP_01725 [Alphaproteobacteria bacterium]